MAPPEGRRRYEDADCDDDDDLEHDAMTTPAAAASAPPPASPASIERDRLPSYKDPVGVPSSSTRSTGAAVAASLEAQSTSAWSAPLTAAAKPLWPTHNNDQVQSRCDVPLAEAIAEAIIPSDEGLTVLVAVARPPLEQDQPPPLDPLLLQTRTPLETDHPIPTERESCWRPSKYVLLAVVVSVAIPATLVFLFFLDIARGCCLG